MMRDPAGGDIRLVLAPTVGFVAVESAILAAGLRAGPDDAVTPPAIPGEREFAYWTTPDLDASVHYAFNPAVFLRVLVVSGPSSARLAPVLAERLPHLTIGDIAALLQSSTRREVLLGLYAAGELKTVGLLQAVAELRVHTDRRISQTAAQVAEKLGLALVALGAEWLAGKQRREPDRSAVFSQLGDAEVRRQTVIWLLRDGHGAAPDIAKVLRTALDDADWHVRVAAMLVTVRLGVSVLWGEVRRIALPTTSRSGLDDAHRSLLRAIHKAALAELAGEPMPSGDGQRTTSMRRLRDVVAGRARSGQDEIAAWIDGFLTLPDERPAPATVSDSGLP